MVIQDRDEELQADGDEAQSLHEENEVEDYPTLRNVFGAISQQQRFLAGIDLSTFAALQPPLVDVSAMTALMEGVAKSVTQSINLPALEAIARSIQVPTHVEEALRLHTQWAKDLASSFDLPAITKANELILGSSALWEASQRQQEIVASIMKQLDHTALTSRFSSLIAGIDWEVLRKSFESWLPANLRNSEHLELVEQICLEEGLPLAWVPRAEIVRELAEAATALDRQRILEEHYEEILDDCQGALADVTHEWANQCRNAISAMRQTGLEAPAQSHAAGIIDSIVLAILGGNNGRRIATQKAEEPLGDLVITVVAEHLVLRPLFLGFTEWWPGRGDPIPSTFARHATAHAVGRQGVFSRLNALVSVMLATSLTVQFWDDPAAHFDLIP